MKLQDIIRPIADVCIKGTTDKEITNIQIDSRKIKEGGLFIAIKGTQADGHAYIEKAIQLGATAIVCEVMPEQTSEHITYIQVKNSEAIVGEIATTFYGNPTSKLKLVGVTGTNGKTTIATLLYKMFRHFG